MSSLVEQIQAAYERDQREARKPVTLSDLPLSYEDITPQWLSLVLCRNTPGAEVVSLRLDVRDSGSSNRRKIAVQYNAAGTAAGLPTALFCKASHELANRIVLGVSGGAEIETWFYNNARPLLDIEAPEGVFAAFDPQSFNSLVVLKDLSQSVTEFCSHKTRMTRARAESQMRLLGTMHGQSFAKPALRKALEALPTWPQYFERTKAFGMEDGSNAGFIDGKDVIPPRLFARYDEIWTKTLQSVDEHNRLPLTLQHGDVHLKNWYVAGNGEMGLSDWQCASRGSWARDFGYAMTTALTVEDRRAWEQDLLRYYLDRLHAAGGPKLSFDEAWLQYRRQLMSALTWWTITLHPAPGMPDMQPRDITLEFVRRIATAMDDVETLDAF